MTLLTEVKIEIKFNYHSFKWLKSIKYLFLWACIRSNTKNIGKKLNNCKNCATN